MAELKGTKIVLSLGFVSHLEHGWEDPSMARFLRRLASFSRLIVFDKRGTGMSDRVPDDRPALLEDRVSDIATLMDTVGWVCRRPEQWLSSSLRHTRRERGRRWYMARLHEWVTRIPSTRGRPIRVRESGSSM